MRLRRKSLLRTLGYLDLGSRHPRPSRRNDLRLHAAHELGAVFEFRDVEPGGKQYLRHGAGIEAVQDGNGVDQRARAQCSVEREGLWRTPAPILVDDWRGRVPRCLGRGCAEQIKLHQISPE